MADFTHRRMDFRRPSHHGVLSRRKRAASLLMDEALIEVSRLQREAVAKARAKRAAEQGVNSMSQNPNCDGNKCHSDKGEVRVYPLGAGGNLILCRACWAHENRFRHERGDLVAWPPEDWSTAAVYPDDYVADWTTELHTEEKA